jgi:hypothetical protein
MRGNGNERLPFGTGADAQLGRQHAAVPGRMVPRVPRAALVDRAAGLEGLAGA